LRITSQSTNEINHVVVKALLHFVLVALIKKSAFSRQRRVILFYAHEIATSEVTFKQAISLKGFN